MIDADNRSLADQAEGLLDNLPAHDVLFYPIAVWDLDPLRRVSHLVDVFVLCDWRWQRCASRFDQIIGQAAEADGTRSGLELLRQGEGQRSFDVPAKQVEAITGVSKDFGLFHEPAWVAGKQPWCRITRLIRRIGDLERPLWLVYIVGNCVEIHQRLFLERGAAPKLLWLQCPLGADLDRWPAFVSPKASSVASSATRCRSPGMWPRYAVNWAGDRECCTSGCWPGTLLGI